MKFACIVLEERKREREKERKREREKERKREREKERERENRERGKRRKKEKEGGREMFEVSYISLDTSVRGLFGEGGRAQHSTAERERERERGVHQHAPELARERERERERATRKHFERESAPRAHHRNSCQARLIMANPIHSLCSLLSHSHTRTQRERGNRSEMCLIYLL